MQITTRHIEKNVDRPSNREAEPMGADQNTTAGSRYKQSEKRRVMGPMRVYIAALLAW